MNAILASGSVPMSHSSRRTFWKLLPDATDAYTTERLWSDHSRCSSAWKPSQVYPRYSTKVAGSRRAASMASACA
ncbi:MAG: hypothetical protein ACE37F_26130 [Nannocystaceae bacterium]|nr:hypothetical protein [bacterium]